MNIINEVTDIIRDIFEDQTLNFSPSSLRYCLVVIQHGLNAPVVSISSALYTIGQKYFCFLLIINSLDYALIYLSINKYVVNYYEGKYIKCLY